MSIRYEPAPAHLAAEYIRLRGMTRENAATKSRLRELGVTVESWSADIRSGELYGTIALLESRIVGYCFGNTRT